MSGWSALTFAASGEDVMAQLDALGQAARQAAIDAATRKAHAIAETARQLAPVQSGALRASIGTDCIETEHGAQATVFAGAPYAASVELGLGGKAPQPFLYPAFVASLGDGTK